MSDFLSPVIPAGKSCPFQQLPSCTHNLTLAGVRIPNQLGKVAKHSNNSRDPEVFNDEYT